MSKLFANEDEVIEQLDEKGTVIHTVMKKLLEMEHNQAISTEWVMEETGCEYSSANWAVNELEDRGVLYRDENIPGNRNYYTLDVFSCGARTPKDWKEVKEIMRL